MPLCWIFLLKRRSALSKVSFSPTRTSANPESPPRRERHAPARGLRRAVSTAVEKPRQCTRAPVEPGLGEPPAGHVFQRVRAFACTTTIVRLPGQLLPIGFAIPPGEPRRQGGCRRACHGAGAATRTNGATGGGIVALSAVNEALPRRVGMAGRFGV